MKKPTKEDIKTLKKIFEETQEEYIHDLYIFKKVVDKPTNSKKNYVEQTINIFKKNHPSFKIELINTDIKDIFRTLVENKDTFIQIDEGIVLKEIYGILFNIHQTNLQLQTITSKNYPKNYFARFQQDIREIKRESKNFKKQIIKPRTPLSNKKEVRFKWKIYNFYQKDPILFEFFMSHLLLADLEKLVGIEKIKLDDLIIILDMLSFLTTQKTTPNCIKKSLWIILFYRLKNHLHFTSTESEQYTYELMLNLFDYELLKIDTKIYIRSTINGIPIFGAKRKSHYTPQKIDFIEKKFKKENKSKTVKENLQRILKEGIDSPQIQYIQKYPRELLQINPKYLD